jgi:hypothetical protein
MDKHDYDPVLDSRYNCEKCEDSGFDIETGDYCEHCQSGARRCNNDKFAEMLRGSPFLEAMWTMNQATMKSERAIAAADLALLKSKLLQAERELAEVRKDAQRYRHLRDAETLNQTIWDALDGIGSDEPEGYRRGFDRAVDAAIDAASVAQANKEQDNG